MPALTQRSGDKVCTSIGMIGQLSDNKTCKFYWNNHRWSAQSPTFIPMVSPSPARGGPHPYIIIYLMSLLYWQHMKATVKESRQSDLENQNWGLFYGPIDSDCITMVCLNICSNNPVVKLWIDLFVILIWNYLCWWVSCAHSPWIINRFYFHGSILINSTGFNYTSTMCVHVCVCVCIMYDVCMYC